MRQITQEAIEAFMSKTSFYKSNTCVAVDEESNYCTLQLHGNIIARHMPSNDIMVTAAGWMTTTTKERLNGIPGVEVYQRKGLWYLNGKQWDGQNVSLAEWNRG